MKIKFMGAAGTVTGSSYILTSEGGKSILIDLGMFQGPAEIDKMNHDPYEYDCSLLVGGILTHAHLDHCGRLPIVLKSGFRGDIWMTAPTAELARLALLDTAKIAKNDFEEILFDKDEALAISDRFRTVDYHQPISIGDFEVTFFDAGHIIGSAFLEIIDKSALTGSKKIVFSGDLGNTPEELVRATETITNADVVVMESTYGDRFHPDEDAIDILQQEINIIENNQGTLLIPAFALERSQELLHMINHLKQSQKVKDSTPIFIDSPMAEKATEIYLKYPSIFNDHIRGEFRHSNPFTFAGLQIIRDHSDSEAIHAYNGAKVIIAGSGMMTGGRILSHAIKYLPEVRNRLLIVGYQGEGTIGRLLAEGEKRVDIEGVEVVVNATISKTEGMSSHADQRQLLDWLKKITGVSKVILTHGEDVPRRVLSEKIQSELGISDIFLPIIHQEIEF